MSNWEEDKKNYLKILEKANKTIDGIFEIDSSKKIIGGYYEKVLELKEKNEKYYDKLSKDLFEVAIIGLEKAGKSTFVNALINNELMPEGEARCTYTSTQLEYGNDEAIIEFFTIEEFNKKFRMMLKEVNYSNFENISFDTVSLGNMEEHFEQLKIKDIKTEEEIKEIIQKKEELLRYLNKDKKVFSGSELLKEEFKSFITNPGKARAVKKITLKSQKLSNMKNIVVYDVPGFDSPTLIHEAQTMDKIKNCDAIILVSDISSKPNLNLHQLQVLLKEADNDGIRIDEKFFVFGNKIDRCNNKKGTEVCIEALESDVLKYKIAVKNRIFIGSAYAYLKNMNNEQDDSIKKMIDFNLEKNIKEPEILKNKLELYNKNERFEVLKRKINRNIEDIKEIFKNIIDENGTFGNIENSSFLSNELLLKYYSDFKKSIKGRLDNINYEIKTKGKEYKEEFEKKLIDAINSELHGISHEEVDEKKKQDSSLADGLAAEKINMKLRDDLYTRNMDSFSKVVFDITDEIAENINRKIVNDFMESLALSSSNIYFEEIKKQIEEVINETVKEVSYDKKMTLPLIERFSRSVFDVIIYSPLNSSDRVSKFESVKQDIYSLSTYDESFIASKPFYAQPMIKMILCQNEKLTIKKIQEKLADLGKCIQEKNVNLNEVEEFSERVLQNSIDVEMLIKNVKNKLETLEPKGETSKDKAILSRIIDTQISNLIGFDIEKSEKDFINEMRLNIKNSETEEDISNEINKDVEILKTILKNVVIKAMSIEKPFLSIMNKQVVSLKEAVENDKLLDFFAKYSNKIKHSEFGRIEVEKANYENRKKIVAEIESTLKNMEV